jgi:hypothetical protein
MGKLETAQSLRKLYDEINGRPEPYPGLSSERTADLLRNWEGKGGENGDVRERIQSESLVRKRCLLEAGDL